MTTAEEAVSLDHASTGDAESDFFTQGPAALPGPSFPEGDGLCQVVLAEHPHPLCRMRALVGLLRGAEVRAYEIEGPQGASLIDMLLGVARPALTVRRADDFDSLVVVKSFPVEESAVGAVESALFRYLTGNTPGLLPVAQSMAFFHAGHGAFEVLRAAAGHPEVRLHRMGAGDAHASILATRQLPIRGQREGSAK